MYLTPSEASKMLRVHHKTLARWADNGWIGFTRTLGGHRRYLREDVEKIINGNGAPRKKIVA